VNLDSVAEYRAHFEDEYCAEPLVTFDGLSVCFEPDDFDHAFFEGDYKHRFSRERAERINWIGAALQDQYALLFKGWDRTVGYTMARRVCLAGDYVAVIALDIHGDARFKTAYVANSETRRKILASPRWPWRR
jgi:hypothetical protein